jgi:hypothetical protein
MHPQTITEVNNSTTIDIDRDWVDRLTRRDDDDRPSPPVIASRIIANVMSVRSGGTMSIIIVPMFMMAIPTAVMPMVVVPVVIHLLHSN